MRRRDVLAAITAASLNPIPAIADIARSMWFAVYDERRGWLMDTCAGGTWTFDVDDSVWFGSRGASHDAMVVVDRVRSSVVVRMR